MQYKQYRTVASLKLLLQWRTCIW